MMMKLLAAGPSPYVRKARITAKMKGLDGQLEVVSPDAAEADAMRARNPLAKIPVLLLDDGAAIFDSHVICEYLDSLVAAPVLFPGDGMARWEMLTRASLADGMIDAALLLVYEGRYRPQDKWVQDWIDMQQAKIDQGLAHFEAAPPTWNRNPDYSHITLAVALGYLDFRHDGKWRQSNPKLVDWLNTFSETVPAFSETMPPAGA